MTDLRNVEIRFARNADWELMRRVNQHSPNICSMSTFVLIRASGLSCLDYFNSIPFRIAKVISLKYIFDHIVSHFLFKTYP